MLINYLIQIVVHVIISIIIIIIIIIIALLIVIYLHKIQCHNFKQIQQIIIIQTHIIIIWILFCFLPYNLKSYTDFDYYLHLNLTEE